MVEHQVVEVRAPRNKKAGNSGRGPICVSGRLAPATASNLLFARSKWSYKGLTLSVSNTDREVSG